MLLSIAYTREIRARRVPLRQDLPDHSREACWPPHISQDYVRVHRRKKFLQVRHLPVFEDNSSIPTYAQKITYNRLFGGISHTVGSFHERRSTSTSPLHCAFAISLELQRCSVCEHRPRVPFFVHDEPRSRRGERNCVEPASRVEWVFGRLPVSPRSQPHDLLKHPDNRAHIPFRIRDHRYPANESWYIHGGVSCGTTESGRSTTYATRFSTRSPRISCISSSSRTGSPRRASGSAGLDLCRIFFRNSNMLLFLTGLA